MRVKELQDECRRRGIFVPELPPHPKEEVAEPDKGTREKLRLRGNSSSGRKKIKREVEDHLLRLACHLEEVMRKAEEMGDSEMQTKGKNKRGRDKARSRRNTKAVPSREEEAICEEDAKSEAEQEEEL